MDLNELENLKSKIDLSRVGKPALIGLAMILVMVAVTAGRYAIDTATATEIQLERTVQEEPGESGGASAGAESPDASQDPRDSQTVFVHVSGAVRSSGLVELESGARVADAVEAAGGADDDACLDAVNLARKVEDGEHVHIPSVEEYEQVGEAPVKTGEAQAAEGSSGKVNINTASAAELEELPGIGPSTAGKIVADRESNGAFDSVEDLMRVSGIGEKKFASLEGLVCV